MTQIIEQLTQPLLEIAGILLTAFAGWLGLQLKLWLDTQQKRSIAESSVKYVEQVAKALGSDEKLALAKETVLDRLSALNIKITDTELTVLIEAAVQNFTEHYKVTSERPEVTQ